MKTFTAADFMAGRNLETDANRESYCKGFCKHRKKHKIRMPDQKCALRSGGRIYEAEAMIKTQIPLFWFVYSRIKGCPRFSRILCTDDESFARRTAEHEVSYSPYEMETRIEHRAFRGGERLNIEFYQPRVNRNFR